jgi:hypothetical protein
MTCNSYRPPAADTVASIATLVFHLHRSYPEGSLDLQCNCLPGQLHDLLSLYHTAAPNCHHKLSLARIDLLSTKYSNLKDMFSRLKCLCNLDHVGHASCFFFRSTYNQNTPAAGYGDPFYDNV